MITISVEYLVSNTEQISVIDSKLKKLIRKESESSGFMIGDNVRDIQFEIDEKDFEEIKNKIIKTIGRDVEVYKVEEN